jgi:hypothetical protein
MVAPAAEECFFSTPASLKRHISFPQSPQLNPKYVTLPSAPSLFWGSRGNSALGSPVGSIGKQSYSNYFSSPSNIKENQEIFGNFLSAKDSPALYNGRLSQNSFALIGATGTAFSAPVPAQRKPEMASLPAKSFVIIEKILREMHCTQYIEAFRHSGPCDDDLAKEVAAEQGTPSLLWFTGMDSLLQHKFRDAAAKVILAKKLLSSAEEGPEIFNSGANPINSPSVPEHSIFSANPAGELQESSILARSCSAPAELDLDNIFYMPPAAVNLSNLTTFGHIGGQKGPITGGNHQNSNNDEEIPQLTEHNSLFFANSAPAASFSTYFDDNSATFSELFRPKVQVPLNHGKPSLNPALFKRKLKFSEPLSAEIGSTAPNLAKFPQENKDLLGKTASDYLAELITEAKGINLNDLTSSGPQKPIFGCNLGLNNTNKSSWENIFAQDYLEMFHNKLPRVQRQLAQQIFNETQPKLGQFGQNQGNNGPPAKKLRPASHTATNVPEFEGNLVPSVPKEADSTGKAKSNKGRPAKLRAPYINPLEFEKAVENGGSASELAFSPFELAPIPFILDESAYPSIFSAISQGLPQQCPNCPKSFRVFSEVSRFEKHIRIHNRELLPYKCSVPGCGQRFNHRGSQLRHIRSHAPNCRLFVCDEPGCGQVCKQEGNLISHKFIHKNVKRYNCSFLGCSEGYNHKSGLTNHEAKKHTAQQPRKPQVSQPQPNKKQRKAKQTRQNRGETTRKGAEGAESSADELEAETSDLDSIMSAERSSHGDEEGAEEPAHLNLLPHAGNSLFYCPNYNFGSLRA